MRILGLTASLVLALASHLVATEKPQIPIVISDVTVLTMRGTQRLEHKTVLISGDSIVWIGAEGAKRIPPNARIIDGSGRFLIPGLTDAHVHLLSWGPDLPPELPLFLAAGVTTVHVMMGSAAELLWRRRLQTGELIGPRLFVAGPILTTATMGFPASHKVTPISFADGSEVVREQVKAGYDFIKIYDGLPSAAYEGAVEAARVARIPVRGHIPEAVGLAGVLKAGQTIEHVEKIVYEGWPSHVFDTAQIPRIADSVRRAGSWVSTTLGVHENSARLRHGKFDSLMARPEVALAPNELIEWWKTSTAKNRAQQPPPATAQYDRFTDFQLALARGLHHAGVPLLAGTDAPNVLLVPGFSLRDELELLVTEVGLTPFEALQTATVNPAIIARDTSRSGRIEVGKRADLVLLEGDPTADIHNIRRVVAVIAGGRYYTPGDIAALLHPGVTSTQDRQQSVTGCRTRSICATANLCEELKTAGPKLRIGSSVAAVYTLRCERHLADTDR